MKTPTFIAAGRAARARTIITPRHLLFRRACFWTGFLAFAAMALWPQRAQAAITEAWVQRFGSEVGSDDYAYKAVTDAAGNVIVAGSIGLIKYSSAGLPLWTNGPGRALAVDSSGNVFVTWGSATLAYSSAGLPLWTNRYSAATNSLDLATAVAVDGSGNVFVTGYSYRSGSRNDYVTIAYSGAGVPLWTSRYNGPANDEDRANAVAVDASGNVFVTGTSVGTGNYDYATVAYSGAGALLWTKRYNGTGNDHDVARAVAVDASGNVFVTGSSVGNSGHDAYATIAYSGAGVALWTNRYNATTNSYDQASAAVLDTGGKVFVTGNSATIAYSSAGVPLWTNLNAGQANALAVDGSGNVFVTGGLYATTAYSGAGVPLWTNRYNGPGNGFDQANAVAVDGSGNVFVTGYSYGSGGDTDYATIAYSGTGVALWTNRYGGRRAAYDAADAVAVDASGNVFVTGYSASATVKYLADGTGVWTNSGGGALAVDGNGNVIVTGSSTIKYSSAGVLMWTNGGGAAIAVDGSGNVFVTMSRGGDYETIAYSGVGLPLWTNRYNGPDSGLDFTTAMAVDGSGNVFVTGYSYGAGEEDYATIAYSAAGVPLWTNCYHGPGNGHDFATAVAVDGSGNVFVTGNSTGSGSSHEYATIAYSAAGVPLSTNIYKPAWSGAKSSLAIGSDGAVYIAGGSDGDFATVKYVWQTELAIQRLSTIPPQVNLTLSGAPNSFWAIERALELTGPWTNLSALLIGTNGSAQFQDTNSPSPAGFYRARLQ